MGDLHNDERGPAAAAVSAALAEIKLATAMPAAVERVGNVEGFVNPLSDLFPTQKFHHVEFWCGDAANTWRRFSWGLGMSLVAKSDQSTGNHTFCSYVIRSDDAMFTFTAPYSQKIEKSSTKTPHPGYNADEAGSFFLKHGIGVRALAILVQDAEASYRLAIENGGVGVLEPVVLGFEKGGSAMRMSEVKLCGDVVLRFVSNHGFTGPYLPEFKAVKSPPLSYGIRRIDHVAANVPRLEHEMKDFARFTGFHPFSEQKPEEFGPEVESGLRSLFVANNNEMILIGFNEPIFGTKRQSQIQTYLDHNEGPGVQHLAVMCDDIFLTLREMRMRTHLGGFDFMPKAPSTYYKQLPQRIGTSLTEKQYKECEELGIMVDKNEEGVLLQIFTQPIGDRPTIFVEIIQRICSLQQFPDNQIAQRGGCGGFGKGNFTALFKSIEEYEKTLLKEAAGEPDPCTPEHIGINDDI